MVEHLQSGKQTMAPEDSARQVMPHFCEIGCKKELATLNFYQVDKSSPWHVTLK